MTSTGIVLSGGGARGAYEVGVLGYLFGAFSRRVGDTPGFDVFNGTSVGAVNATALASTAHDPVRGVEILSKVWLEQNLSDVLHFNLRQAARIYRVISGGDDPSGIFDPRPFTKLVTHKIPWRHLANNLKSKRIRGLTVSMTNLRTGRSTLYVDRAPGVALPQSGLRIEVRASAIRPSHVLASAAMPVIFPPVRIGNEYFCDGGIRMNTPTSPAIQMGVDRMLVIGVSTPGKVPSSPPLSEIAAHGIRAPSASALLGKALNALMLDHVDHDLAEVQLVNQILADAEAVCGERFLEKLNGQANQNGRPSRRLIQTFVLRPSVDIGEIASEHLRTHKLRLGKILGKAVLRTLDVGEGASADLASYVLFDSDFSRALFDLGYNDASACRDELEKFLFSN
ncbi:MAG: patatin-like phospholipase family protein [Deltaproteobacteria bacterium]|nr:patatin-like phospholipase family protein [Deltaproteobacteria bacterium]